MIGQRILPATYLRGNDYAYSPSDAMWDHSYSLPSGN